MRVTCRMSLFVYARTAAPIDQPDGWLRFFLSSPRTGHVCLILAVSPDRTISAPLPKGVGKTIARPLPIMLAVQRFLSNNRKAVSKLCRNLALFCLTTAIPLPKMLKLSISAFFLSDNRKAAAKNARLSAFLCLTIARPLPKFERGLHLFPFLC